MIGAIAGDIIGSVYEYQPIKTEAFPLFGEGCSFTDDTVLTVATADAILEGCSFGDRYRHWGRRYPDRSYGSLFRQWLRADDPAPYGSWGNGAAMRVSPVGLAAESLEEALRVAEHSARATHDHPDGIRGAQAVAGCVFLARTGVDKAGLRGFLEGRMGYRLGMTLSELRPKYRFDATARGSVPQALTAFLESDGFEDAVRKAVSLGGDSDTQAAMAGAVAEPFYGGVPDEIWKRALGRLTCELGAVVARFYARYSLPLGAGRIHVDATDGPVGSNPRPVPARDRRGPVTPHRPGRQAGKNAQVRA